MEIKEKWLPDSLMKQTAVPEGPQEPRWDRMNPLRRRRHWSDRVKLQTQKINWIGYLTEQKQIRHGEEMNPEEINELKEQNNRRQENKTKVPQH